MDFDHVGVHCQYESCNQKDFLPFRCDLCNKMLCLQHRSVLAHSCGSQDARDMTSNDCPLCGKSFKFLRSEDPNTAWQQHFTMECAQSGGGTIEAKIKCYSNTCRNILGPSNTYQCKVCHQKVCLTHRNPEDHQCNNGRAAALEKRFAASVAASPASNRSKATSKKNVAKGAASADPSNTLKGSAQRRMVQKAPSPPLGTAPASFDCPFCGIIMTNSDALQEHVNSQHLSDTMSSNSAPKATPAPQREMCPQCQETFDDLTALISHVENKHQQAGGTSISDNCVVN